MQTNYWLALIVILVLHGSCVQSALVTNCTGLHMFCHNGGKFDTVRISTQNSPLTALCLALDLGRALPLAYQPLASACSRVCPAYWPIFFLCIFLDCFSCWHCPDCAPSHLAPPTQLINMCPSFVVRVVVVPPAQAILTDPKQGDCDTSKSHEPICNDISW